MQIKSFFRLPLEEKLPIANDRTHSQQRGWCLPGEEKTWYLESNKGDIEAPKFNDCKVWECHHRGGRNHIGERWSLTIG